MNKMSKVFISELAEFMGSNTASNVSDMMGTAAVNNTSLSKKILWLLITGVVTIGCSYLGYRFAGGKIPSDD
jgi:hypothetical protein